MAKRYLPMFVTDINRFLKGVYALWNAGLKGQGTDIVDSNSDFLS
jgi:hypothetical protein